MLGSANTTCIVLTNTAEKHWMQHHREVRPYSVRIAAETCFPPGSSPVFGAWCKRQRGQGSSLCFLRVDLVSLFAQMCFDLVPEDQHSQLSMRGLVHGLGLHAHAILLGGQLVHAPLLVPQVEEAADWRPNHYQIAVEVLAVEVNVLTSPAFYVQVKATYKNRWSKCSIIMWSS